MIYVFIRQHFTFAAARSVPNTRYISTDPIPVPPVRRYISTDPIPVPPVRPYISTDPIPRVTMHEDPKPRPIYAPRFGQQQMTGCYKGLLFHHLSPSDFDDVIIIIIRL